MLGKAQLDYLYNHVVPITRVTVAGVCPWRKRTGSTRRQPPIEGRTNCGVFVKD
jgi:hypothetical protein